jgi:hypothetical protein
MLVDKATTTRVLSALRHFVERLAYLYDFEELQTHIVDLQQHHTLRSSSALLRHECTAHTYTQYSPITTTTVWCNCTGTGSTAYAWFMRARLLHAPPRFTQPGRIVTRFRRARLPSIRPWRRPRCFRKENTIQQPLVFPFSLVVQVSTGHTKPCVLRSTTG